MEEDEEAPIPPTPPRQPSPAPREPSPEPEPEIIEEEEPVPKKFSDTKDSTKGSNAKESAKGDSTGDRKRKRTRKLVPKTYMDKDGFMGEIYDINRILHYLTIKFELTHKKKTYNVFLVCGSSDAQYRIWATDMFLTEASSRSHYIGHVCKQQNIWQYCTYVQACLILGWSPMCASSFMNLGFSLLKVKIGRYWIEFPDSRAWAFVTITLLWDVRKMSNY